MKTSELGSKPKIRGSAETFTTMASKHAANKRKARLLWDQVLLCVNHISDHGVLRASHTQRILSRFSDNTIVAYSCKALSLFQHLQDLKIEVKSFTVVQLADALESLLDSEDIMLSPIGALKALRWLEKTASISCWPDLYDSLLSSFLIPPDFRERRESLPLPLLLLCQWELDILFRRRQ